MSESLSIKDELLRKLIHICSSFFAYALFFFNQESVCLTVGVGTILILSFELFRINYPSINRIFIKIFGKVTRNFEKTKLTGASYVMVASFIVLLPIFESCVSIVSILIMSYSDTAAAIIGKKYGKIRIFNKTLEGSFAFFIVAFIIILAMYPQINLGVSITAILIATIVELFPSKIDDNFSVPIIVALITSIGFWVSYIG